MNIYAIKDTKVGRFYPPFYADSDEAAILQIKENLLSPSGIQLLRLKDQLEIYLLGRIDFNSGYIIPTDALDVYKSTSILPEDIEDDLPFEEIHDILLSRSAVIFVTSVSAVAETIPQKLLSPEITHEDLKRVYAEIKELSTQLSQLGVTYNSHKHTKKGAYLIDDQKKF